jgi:hypothetical protein
MARPQALSCVSVVVLIKKQVVPPMRVFLKLAIRPETRTMVMRIPAKQTDHTIRDFGRHRQRRYRLSAAASGLYYEFRAQRAPEPEQGADQQIGSWEPQRTAPVGITSLDFFVGFAWFITHAAPAKAEWVLFVILGKAANAVRGKEFIGVPKVLQDAGELA